MSLLYNDETRGRPSCQSRAADRDKVQTLRSCTEFAILAGEVASQLASGAGGMTFIVPSPRWASGVAIPARSSTM
jgi:hypothetical protein